MKQGMPYFGAGTILTAIALLLAVTAVDVVTGTELRVFPLYIMPVAFVASRVKK